MRLKDLIRASQMFGLGIDVATGQPKFYRIARLADRQVHNVSGEGSSDSVLSPIYQDED